MPSLGQIKKDLKNYLLLFRSLYFDPRTPKISKIILWILIGYAFLPFDLIPDFIPILGHLDDLLILPLLGYLAIKSLPPKLYEEHRRRIFINKK
jgi:uncharacterized membrane protein YkvA (DUF1232 family)